MKVVTQNKKAFHDYFILDTYEAGIELKGTEIKSVRLGHVNLKDAFIRFKNDEAFIETCISLLMNKEIFLIMNHFVIESYCFIKSKLKSYKEK